MVKYWCPSCQVSVETGVILTTPPTHPCSRKLNRTIALVKVDDEKESSDNE